MKFISTLLVVFALFAATTSANAFNLAAEPVAPAGLEQFSQMSQDEFLALTPKKVEELTGKKLKVKEALVLKAAQKKLKKASEDPTKPKSQLTALLLVIFIGGLGIHRFYLGYTTIGIVQLLTLGGCGVWSLIDLINIITGNLKPADGSEYDPTL